MTAVFIRRCLYERKNGNQKVSIDYPCRWVYKVIGADETKMRAAIATAIPEDARLQYPGAAPGESM